MSARKHLVLCVLAWGIIPSAVKADPITWPDAMLAQWTTWLAAQPGESGGGPVVIGDPYSAPMQLPAALPSPPAQSAPAPASTSPQGLSLNQVSNGYPGAMASGGANAFVSQTAPPVSAGASSATPVDAYINLGTGPYPLANTITTGNALPWYNSQQIASFFGGQPTAQQQQSFDNTILQRVQQTFSSSGIAVTLTTNPSVPALHTISLVSNTGSASVSDAIGMTQIGASGFSFMDQIAKSAQNLDQLEWIVAHNIAHELMLSFGVPENYDQTGNYVDARNANWAMMVNPDATFSPAASQAINQALQNQGLLGVTTQQGAQLVDPQPAAVPEPTTWAIWALASTCVFFVPRARPQKRGHC
jgi:hypothetical protein